MSSKELEEEVTRILQQVDPVVVEEEEAVEEAIAPEEVNPADMEHIMAVLSAARLMMEAELLENAKEEVEACEETVGVLSVPEVKEEEVKEEVKEEVMEEVKEDVKEEEVKEDVTEDVKEEVKGEVKGEDVKEDVKEEEVNGKEVTEEVKEETTNETQEKEEQTQCATPTPEQSQEEQQRAKEMDRLVREVASLQNELKRVKEEEQEKANSFLKVQIDQIDADAAARIDAIRERVRREVEERKTQEVLEETNRLIERYHVGVQRLHALYQTSREEYEKETEENEKEEMQAAMRQTEDEWREEIERRVEAVLDTVSQEREHRRQRGEKLKQATRRQIEHLHTQDLVLAELEANQEYQKAFIRLQADVKEGKPLAEGVEALKAMCKGDAIMVHLLNRVPTAMLEQGMPSKLEYYTQFRSVYKEARVAGKVPEASGFMGQLLGRAVVALVGSEGLKKDDPLVKLEKMNELLLKGDLEEAYNVGMTMEGGSREVLEAWLEKVKERLDCEKVLEQVRMHAKQNEWSVYQQTRDS